MDKQKEKPKEYLRLVWRIIQLHTSDAVTGYESVARHFDVVLLLLRLDDDGADVLGRFLSTVVGEVKDADVDKLMRHQTTPSENKRDRFRAQKKEIGIWIRKTKVKLRNAGTNKFMAEAEVHDAHVFW